MKSPVYILFTILVLSLLYSCGRGAGEVSSVEEEQDTVMLFEIDSLLLVEECEKGYFSIIEMSPFDICTVVGSMAYGKDFNIDVLMLPSSDSAYIVMSEMFNKDKDGNPLWRLTDSLKIYFPIGSSIGWPGSVVKGDKIDYTLMALMPEDNDWINTEVYDNLLGVWQLDNEEKIINPISTENVVCINESYGVY